MKRLVLFAVMALTLTASVQKRMIVDMTLDKREGMFNWYTAEVVVEGGVTDTVKAQVLDSVQDYLSHR